MRLLFPISFAYSTICDTKRTSRTFFLLLFNSLFFFLQRKLQEKRGKNKQTKNKKLRNQEKTRLKYNRGQKKEEEEDPRHPFPLRNFARDISSSICRSNGMV